MAGRQRMPRHVVEDGRRGLRPGVHDGPPFGRPEGPPVGHRLPPHPAILEEELEIQMSDIRRLLAENRRLAEDRAGMQREIAASKEELHRLNMLIRDIQAEREVQIKGLIDKEMKLEADLRATEPLRAEVVQLRSEIQKLSAARQEMGVQIRGLSHDLKREQAKSQQIPLLRAEVDGLRHELSRARMAFEAEKKANIEHMEQKQAMEKNLVSMAREAEKLRLDISGSEPRPWTSGGSYGATLGSAEMSYPGSYGDGYGPSSGISEKGHAFGVGSGSYAFDQTRYSRR